MDDSCAVCAEPLEWVAYGACGHKEVCSTCVARLRFICNDHRCCICKDESNVVFITKALGDYTRMVNDFSVLPYEVKEGRVGSYWYHEDTQALFDDLDHYKMIKAMCRLSCSVCDKMGDQPTEGSRRRGKFRNIEQLKGHLFHQHRLLMCSLCLEGRKVFICEQKLYTRAQLNQHISTGDSEVDGTESERGGFMGHPMCEFCRSPFYGDNELYSHMSTEHYTCHICQRQHPGQYEYYKNYDDLEIHFRQVHFLCEDDACLAKKFIVFQTENEMKRHNTIEHGGRMSRSKRNAALQIPTSFRYRHGNEDNRRGRGRSFRRDSSDAAALSMAIQASYETANGDGRFHDSSPSVAQGSPDHAEVGDVDPIIQPLELLATGDPEPSSRYLQAVSQRARNAKLEEFSFPPLPMAPGNSQQKPNNGPESLPKNTIAAHLRRQTNKNLTAITSNQAWLPASRGLAISANSPIQVRPTANIPSGGSPSPAQDNVPGFDSFKAWPVASRKPAQPTNSQVHVRHTTPGPSSTSAQNEPPKQKAPAPSNFPSLPQARLTVGDYEYSFADSRSSSKDFYGSSKISRSSSTPNLAANVSFEPFDSDFPPVSTSQTRKQAATHQVILKTENVHTANKSLVEKIRTGLEYDQDKYSAFKDISGEYRQGLMDSGTYLVYVEQFGLSHLVLDLARLCPDAEKQKEMVDIYNANLVSNDSRENFVSNDKARSRDGPGFKGKGKALDAENSSSKDKLSDSILSTVQKLQSSYMLPQEESEVLSKDGYRTGKGKSKVIVDEPRTEFGFASQPLKLKSQDEPRSAGGGSGQSLGDGEGKTKQRKKTPKFIRVRLGDGSVAALSDLKNSDPDPDTESFSSAPYGNKKIGEGLPIRGVWQNGGGQKLFVNDSKRPQN